MKHYKFTAKIINLDGSEVPMTLTIKGNSREEAEKRFYTQIRTENGEMLDIVDFKYVGRLL